MFQPIRPLLLVLLLACLPALAWAQSSTLTGISRSLNPAISVNGLLRGQASRDNPTAELNGFKIDGVEAQFSAVVDPFWRADVLIGLHPEHAHHEEEGEEGEEHAAHGSNYVVEAEEAFIEGQSLPRGLGLKVGKFALPFGKHAPLHMHQYPFADAPVAVASFLGDHLFSDTGLEGTITVPFPWYSDLSVYGVNGDAMPFDAENKNLAAGGRFINLWDLTDDATVELSGSYTHGADARHPGENKKVDIYGADVTWKWVSSSRTRGPAMNVTLEALWPDYEEGEGEPWGWYGLVQYRFHRNWWLGLGAGQADAGLEHHHEEEEEEHGHEGHYHGLEGDLREYKVNFTFVPSEFSSLRAEMVYYQDKVTMEDDLRFIVQANFTIGSHPAHLY
jgi:hypothetical protein